MRFQTIIHAVPCMDDMVYQNHITGNMSGRKYATSWFNSWSALEGLAVGHDLPLALGTGDDFTWSGEGKG
jgi:hypothetical protein